MSRAVAQQEIMREAREQEGAGCKRACEAGTR